MPPIQEKRQRTAPTHKSVAAGEYPRGRARSQEFKIQVLTIFPLCTSKVPSTTVGSEPDAVLRQMAPNPSKKIESFSKASGSTAPLVQLPPGRT